MEFLLTVFLAISSPAAEPERVVRELYATIVDHQPLGIPAGALRERIWPLLTPRLVAILEKAEACEDDYRENHSRPDEKPEYGWLEEGLFSGSNEYALPAAAEISISTPFGDGAYAVRLEFTYRETFETYGRAPDPAAELKWSGTIIVRCEESGCGVDDFIGADLDGQEPRVPLSESFTGCIEGRWRGVSE
jgi:hypothetical protein